MRRRHGWLALQAAGTAILLVIVGRGLDFSVFARLFARLPLWFYMLSLAVVLSGQFIYAWRWRVLLVAAGVTVPFADVVRQYFIGTFVNNFLPSTVGGDVAKVYYLGRQHGYRVVTASVLLDRVLGISLLATIATLGLLSRPSQSRPLAAAHLAVGAVALVSFGVLGLLARGTGGLPQRMARFGATAFNAASRLQRLRTDMAAALTSPAVIVQATFVVAGYLVLLTAIYLEFVSIQTGAVPSFMTMFGVVAATAVLSNIPVSLNGLGLREQLHAVLLAPLGVSPEVAVAISLLLFGHVLVASAVGLVFWLSEPVAPAGAAVALEPPGTLMW